MKVSIQVGSLYNDEVNVPLLSPQLYEKFILPYEIELSKFYGVISYWHSCGNTAPLLRLIRCIPHLQMIHISPWTDLEQSVADLADSGIALEVVLHPLVDVQKATGGKNTFPSYPYTFGYRRHTDNCESRWPPGNLIGQRGLGKDKALGRYRSSNFRMIQ